MDRSLVIKNTLPIYYPIVDFGEKFKKCPGTNLAIEKDDKW